MPEMTPLERAARALYERDGTIFPIVPPGPLLPWGDLTEESKAPWINEARAVLAAIREPDEAILQAMRDTVPVNGYEWDYEDDEAVAHWQAMIDAALAEGATD